MAIVLLIEDDEQNHILMESLIGSMGHNVLHARNGREGLALAREQRPDLILLDMRLPLMNGWEFAEAIKADEDLANIPIIAVSVPVDPTDEPRALEAGCVHYISKPYSTVHMRESIKRFLD